METVLDRLFVSNDESVGKLPAWAAFHLALGGALARAINDEQRIVLAMALPTRAFSAVLLTFGVVATRANIGSSSGGTSIDELCALPLGTKLAVRDGVKWSTGDFIGCRSNDEHRLVGIQFRSGLRHFLPASQLHRVWPAAAVPSKKTAQSQVNSEFLRGLLSSVDPISFVMWPRFDVLLVGQLGLIKAEAQTPIWIAHQRQRSASGTLQDVIGLRQLLPPGHAYRSGVQATAARKPQTAASLNPDTIVLFDGAAAFLRWGEHFSNFNSIVLLDRTDYRLEEAADKLNQNYMKDRIGSESIDFNDDLVPDGVEVMTYREGRR